MLRFPHSEQRDFSCDTKTERNEGHREMKVNNYYNAFLFVSLFFLFVCS